MLYNIKVLTCAPTEDCGDSDMLDVSAASYEAIKDMFWYVVMISTAINAF